MMTKDNLLSLNKTKEFEPQDLSDSSSLSHNDGNGGGGNMDHDKYVTHEELNLTTEKILHHIDNRFNDMDKKFAEVDKRFEQVNTKFEKQKVWFLTTAISLTAAACTIIGFLIKFIK